MIASKITSDELREEIEDTIYYSHLQSIYYKLLKPLVRKNKQTLLDAGVKLGRTINKKFLLDIVTTFLFNPGLRDSLFDSFSPDTKKIMSKLVWKGVIFDQDIVSLISRSMVNEIDGYLERDYQKWIPDEFKLFCFDIQHNYGYRNKDEKLSYSIYLPPKIRSLFKPRFEAPAEASLIRHKTPQEAGVSADAFVFRQENKCPEELKLAQIYYQQGLVTISKQNKPTVATQKKMSKALLCQEYYTQPQTPETALIHINLLSLLTIKLERHYIFWQHKLKKDDEITNLEPIELLKVYFQMLKEGESFSMLESAMLHLKNRHHILYYDSFNETKLHQNLFAELIKMAPGQWVNFQQWRQYLFYNDVDIKVLSLSLASEYLHCDIEMPDDQSRYYYRGKEYVNSIERMEFMVNQPLLKSCLFLYASMGLIDIAYTNPHNTAYQLKNKNYLSVYDGLQGFCVTELGAYILGRTTGYTVKEDDTPKAKIIVDDERLLITFHGTDLLKQTVLDQMTIKVGDNRYKMDYESLMSGCASIGEVEMRIDQFKQQIMSQPPENWQLFFKQVIQQANPLKKKASLLVYKLAEQPELYQIIASDPILKKYILKAEDYHIVIDKTKISALKKRLLVLGYFM